MSFLDELRRQVIRDEGWRNKMYLDSEGIPSIGVGHNLRDVPISDAAVEQIFADDLTDKFNEVERVFPWSVHLSEPRLAVLINMAFMGIGKLRGFVKMLAAMQAGEWERAARELLDSKYHTQVGARAERLAEQLRTDRWT